MSLFPPSSRTQLPRSKELEILLRLVPEPFVDDGCSNSPDSIFGFDLAWACRLHDNDYCTRTSDQGHMTQSERRKADARIKRYIGEALPWRWRWIKWIYYRVLKTAGGIDAWNSCGPECWGDAEDVAKLKDNEVALHAAGLCRHHMPMPEWMAA